MIFRAFLKENTPRTPYRNCITVNVTLGSNVASMSWHTSEAIRADAERLIAKLTSEAHLTTHWLTKTEMTLPVNDETLRMARNLKSSA